MNGNHEVTYALDLGARRNPTLEHLPPTREVSGSIPRIARLMALALRFDGLLRRQSIRDYAELARLGRVTRARITQIMKLLDLAPGIQEEILFTDRAGLNERLLRPVVSLIDWNEQRLLFREIIDRLDCAGGSR
jgi:hypothetical protein